MKRHMCPSMGALRRSIYADLSSTPKCSSRAFSSCVRNFEEQPTTPSAPSTPAQENPNSRRARSATALKQITSLQNRRIQPGGLAKGNFPSGQMAQRNPRPTNPSASNNTGAPAPSGQGERRAPGPRFAKFASRPTPTDGSAPPSGQMVRAPPRLNLTRNAPAGAIRGPNLGGRSAARGGPRGKGGPSGREQGPRKRERKAGQVGGTGKPNTFADINAADTLSNGMVQHLLRLQRKEWDRVPYEPKYAPGSSAANALIHEGRELFRGESAPVKMWGPLEKRIGVVGMFGAEAHLKVRRVPDGDEAPFGKEEEQEVSKASKSTKAV